LKELLIKVINGIELKDIERKDRSLIDELVRKHILKVNKNVIKLDSKYKAGTVDVNRNGVGFLDVLGSNLKDLKIERENLKGANRGDLVIARRVFTKRGRPSAEVVYILEKQFDSTVVYLTKIKEKIVAINIKNEMVIELNGITQKSLRELPKNALLKINNYTGVIEEVLGVLDDSRVDEKISLALYNKKEFFSKKAEDEARSYGNSVDKSMYSDRVDLTDLPFCTIDPNDAKDFDDAIYYDIEKNELYVAIADVSEYVTMNSAIDREAKERCFSIYFPHKSIPMLPRSLSENICSLKPDEYRLAFTFKLTLDSDFKVKSQKLFNAIIKSKRRFTYDEVDEYLAGKNDFFKPIDEEILKYLIPLSKATRVMKNRRLKSGYDFQSDEVRIVLDENLILRDSTLESETPSHSLIEDCMLLANQSAANMFDFGIFRIHEEPKPDKIEELLSNLSYIGIYPEGESSSVHKLIESIQKVAKDKKLSQFVDKLIIKAQKQAKYSSENLGHFGLGFEAYTHFTSPIRRYSDLTLHRLLKSILFDERQKEFILKNIESLTAKISDLEREAVKVEWDFMDRVFARYANEHLNEIFDATVTDTDKNAICKVTSGILKGARVFLVDKKGIELFDSIKISLVDSNIATAKVYGSVVENLGLNT
jgi:ribonuclease R